MKSRNIVLAAIGLSWGCGNTNGPISPNSVKHVLLISVDGLHQVDLSNWVNNNPSFTLARLSKTGITSTATAPMPSDSLPGLLALVTWGDSQEHRRLLRRWLRPHALRPGQ